ncbi:MAG: drug/metabolite transporter (DMT)-like permease [Gammaproteobacteria bacterium]|jgi:drug/metabolite transporter (DMT)-like permease
MKVSQSMQGIGLMVAGTFLLTVQDAVSKWLVSDFHAGEILLYRGLFAYLPIAWFAYHSGGWQALRSRRPSANVARAVLNTSAGFAVISAYQFMPLADVMAIMFASPLLVAALSASMLGERVDWRGWGAVLAGFFGVLIILSPGIGSWAGFDCRPATDAAVGSGALSGAACSGNTFKWFAILPLAAAGFIAFRDILTRRLGAIDGTTVILFYTVTASVIAGAVSLLFFGASWPTPTHWAIFATMGVLNGVAHFMTIRAFALAKAATLAPLRYFALVWAAIIGYAVWNDIPTVATSAGAGLVVASGIYILWRESRARS